MARVPSNSRSPWYMSRRSLSLMKVQGLDAQVVSRVVLLLWDKE
jgi:hypothetical protein